MHASGHPTRPSALTVAGSDSGGGAGIQADLKTFMSLGLHGTSVITCVTAQNPHGVRAIQPLGSKIIIEQFKALADELPPHAAKIGMLYSVRIIRAVLEAMNDFPKIPWVVDPVMVSTSGTSLLQSTALRLLENRLFPSTTLITPNLPEAGHLLARSIKNASDAATAAEALFGRYGKPILLKGGHLHPRAATCHDFLFDDQGLQCLSSPRLRIPSVHGTGCTLSAAITALLAQGLSLRQAVQQGRAFVVAAMGQSFRTGRHAVLNFDPQT